MSLLSIRQYAASKGVSHTFVNRLVQAGKIPMTNGKIDPEVADAAWERNRDSRQASKLSGERPPAAVPPGPSMSPGKSAGAPALGTYAYAQLVHETAKAKRATIAVQALEGQLISAVEVRTAVAGMIARSKSLLVVIGDELGDRLATEQDPVRCRLMVDDRISQALAELAEYPSVA